MLDKYLGIDIGTYNIKLVDVTVNRGSVIMSEPFVVRTPGFLVQNGRIEDGKELEDLLEEAIKRNNFKNRKAVVILNDSVVITRDMELPAASPKETVQMLKLDASEYLPYDVNEYTLRYKILIPARQNPKKANYVMMTAARTGLVMDFYNIFRKIGLTPAAFDVTLNCMIKYLKHTKFHEGVKADEPKTAAIIDFGATTAKIVIMKDGTPLFLQVLNQGSQKIDVILSNSLNIDRRQAEEYKIKYGLDHLKTDNEDPLAEKIGSLINSQIDLMLGDIYKQLSSFSARNGFVVNEVMLTGGMSRMKGLDCYIEEAFGIPCTVIKPDRFAVFETLGFGGAYEEKKMQERFLLYSNIVGAVLRRE